MDAGNTSSLSKTDLKPERDINFILLFCILIVLSVAVILLNTIFLLLMKKNSKLRTLSNKLLVVLAVLDLLHGAPLLPLYGTHMLSCYLGKPTNKWIIKLAFFFGYQLPTMTALAVTTIAVEQMLALRYPFMHGHWVNVHRMLVPLLAVGSMCGCFNIAAVYVAPRLLFHAYVNFLAWLSSALLVAMCCSYYQIIKIARKKVQQTRDLNPSEGQQMRRRAKAAKTSILILTTYIACYAPYVTYTVYTRVNPGVENYHTYACTAPKQSYWLDVVTMSSALWDSCIYIWRLKAIRKAVQQLLSGHSHCKVDLLRNSIMPAR